MTAALDNRADLMSQLERMVSEGRNPKTMGIDLMSSLDILKTMNGEDATVPAAVEKVLPAIARTVDVTVDAFHRGGRLVYIGAGTSGRLGVLDASECPPTFGVPPEMVVGIIAGGLDALITAAEGAEDHADAAAADLEAIELSENDVVVGIAVSGRTPYVIGALNHARSVGATAVSLCCNPGSPISEIADIAITPVVGPEVVTGSTRLKSGTAQKLVLNMISTASMIRIGKTYENLMVDLHASNEKLLARAVLIVMRATGCTPPDARKALEATGNDVKLAILVLATGMEPDAARQSLDAANGFLRNAIKTSISQLDSSAR